jgi:hypothetical protein
VHEIGKGLLDQLPHLVADDFDRVEAFDLSAQTGQLAYREGAALEFDAGHDSQSGAFRAGVNEIPSGPC